MRQFEVSRPGYSAKKKKGKCTCSRADGIIDLSRGSCVDGIGYRPRHPKVRTTIVYQGEYANTPSTDEAGRMQRLPACVYQD